jgi:hypothetical protein
MTLEADDHEGIAIIDAIESWYLDGNPEPLCGLLPHAAGFHGRYRVLLEALRPLFNGRGSPSPIDALNAIKHSNKGEDAQTLEEFLEAVPERTRSREIPLLLYQPPPLDILPPRVQAFVRAGAGSVGCDVAYVLLSVLAALACAIGLSRRLRILQTWFEAAILWLCTVAPSGAKKSPPLELGIKPLWKIEEELYSLYEVKRAEYERKKLKYDAELAEWKRKHAAKELPEKPSEPPEPRYVVSNTTVEALAPILHANPRGLLLVRDELGGWLESFDAYRGGRGGDAAAWEELYHGRRLTVDRKTGDRRSIRVPRAAVSVTGTIQPETLRRLLTPKLLEGGLAARIFFATPRPALGGKPHEEVSSEIENDYSSVLRRLTGLRMKQGEQGILLPVDLSFAPEAEVAWWHWVEKWAKERRDLEGPLAAAAAKLEGGVARLALILHLAFWAEGNEPEPDSISQERIKAAIRLGQWFWREARRLYGVILRDEEGVSQSRLRLVAWIERRGGDVSPRELANSGPREFRGKTEVAEAALQELVAAGCGRWFQVPAQDGPGRPPSPRFRLLTHGSGNETHENPEKSEISFPYPDYDSDHTNGEGLNGESTTDHSGIGDGSSQPQPNLPSGEDEEGEWKA